MEIQKQTFGESISTPATTTPRRILIVEDDIQTSALVKTYLQREGFETLIVEDGLMAIAAIEQYQFVFVVLDLMLPGADGWEICRFIRTKSQVPILFLTARDDEIDRVAGLEVGADDYVVKPFSPRELVARIKAILRRTSIHHSHETRVTTFSSGALMLIPEKRKVTLEGKSITLTASEYVLLETIMARPGRVFSREELLDRLYPNGESVVDRVVDVHIGKLRRKLEADPNDPFYIKTVRGIGYQFSDEL